MTFLHPLGFLGLLAIPVLILIYIIKSKYRESTVASVYLWELSDKFMKKKTLLSSLSGIISLLLQIMVVINLSLSIAHPFLLLKGMAKNYIFILDNSASMNYEVGDPDIDGNRATRFTLAQDLANAKIESTGNGSTYTVIVAGDYSYVVLEKCEDKSKAQFAIKSLSTTQLHSTIDEGLNLAQTYYDEDPTMQIYLYTDKNFEDEGYNVNVINVNATCQQDTLGNNICSYGGYNVTFGTFAYEIDYEDSDRDGYDTEYVFYGDVYSYGDETEEVSIQLFIDGVRKTTMLVPCTSFLRDNIYVGHFKYNSDIDSETSTFNKAVVQLNNVKDDLSYDDRKAIYNIDNKLEYKAVVVSDNAFFISTAIGIIGTSEVDVYSTGNYNDRTTGYDIYIFDGYCPASLPTDGAVWIIGAKGLLPQAAGVTYQSYVEPENGANLAYTSQGGETYTKVTKDLTENVISVGEFCNYSINSSSSLVSILNYTDAANQVYPMVMAGKTSTGNREVVFSFGFNHSNFPLLVDYMILLRNLVAYSLPAICDVGEYENGDYVSFNLIPEVTDMTLKHYDADGNADVSVTLLNDGKSNYLSEEGLSVSCRVEKLGYYTLEYVVGGTTKKLEIFVGYPTDEKNPAINDESSASLTGEPSQSKIVSNYDMLLYVVILLLIFCMLEWGVYLYDQRRVR